MARNGKIARLPRELREELNRRLAENEPGDVLLKWLNGLPAMRSLLDREFGGKPVSKQNLCEWRARGFAEWQARREILGSLDGLAAEAEELTEAADGKLTAHLATVLAGRYAAAIAGWNGEVDEALRLKLKVLHGLCRDVAALRWGELREARRELKEERKGNPKSEEPKAEVDGMDRVDEVDGVGQGESNQLGGRSLNPKSESPKSERSPKAEIRRAGGPQACTQTEDEHEDEHEDDTRARQGAVKVGQTNSECGTRSAEGPKCQKMGTEEVRSLNPKAEEPKSERNPKSEGRIVGGTKGGTKTEDDDEEAPKAWTG
jgi:hypothetical protein